MWACGRSPPGILWAPWLGIGEIHSGTPSRSSGTYICPVILTWSYVILLWPTYQPCTMFLERTELRVSHSLDLRGSSPGSGIIIVQSSISLAWDEVAYSQRTGVRGSHTIEEQVSEGPDDKVNIE